MKVLKPHLDLWPQRWHAGTWTLLRKKVSHWFCVLFIWGRGKLPCNSSMWGANCGECKSVSRGRECSSWHQWLSTKPVSGFRFGLLACFLFSILLQTFTLCYWEEWMAYISATNNSAFGEFEFPAAAVVIFQAPRRKKPPPAKKKKNFLMSHLELFTFTDTQPDFSDLAWLQTDARKYARREIHNL